MPAIRPWCRDCWPSVAETWEISCGTKRTGSEPVCSTSAMFLASDSVGMFEISAPPIDGSMPPPYFVKSMLGVDSSLLSRMTPNVSK